MPVTLMAKLLVSAVITAAASPPPPCSDGGSKNCSCSPTNTEHPRFHITGLGGGAHDVNAIFSWKGKWHVFNQRDDNWGHLVSSDFATWTRLPDALVGGSWDGSLTLVDGQPIILYDCTSVANCRPPKPGTTVAAGSHSQVKSGDPPLIGVARPADLTDELLTNWTKDPKNPVVFAGAQTTYSGPSTIWKNSATAKYQMEQILGQTTGLFETSDPNFHNWKLVNSSFFPQSGSGGGIFLPLPNVGGSSNTIAAATAAATTEGGRDAAVAVAAAAAGPARSTHMLNMGHECKNFILGTFEAATSIFLPTPANVPDRHPVRVPIDLGEVYFSEVNIVDGGRMIHVGWVIGADCLTTPREISYDATLEQLLSNPVAELRSLRGALISHPAAALPAVLKAGSSLALFDGKTNETAYDLELAFALVPGQPLSIAVSLLSAVPPPSSGCGIGDHFCFEVDVSVDHVAVFKSSGVRDYSFALPAGTSELTVRALVDRNIMEVFVAGGRAVSTYGCGAGGRICPARPVTAELGAWVTAVSAVTVNSALAWEMGCGWAV